MENKQEEVEVKVPEDTASPLEDKSKEEIPAYRKNKKLIYGIVAAAIMIIVCIGAFAYNEQQRKQKILDSIQVTFIDELIIEYGSKDFDYASLIKDKTDEVILPEAIDTMVLGEKELVYKVEKEGLTKEFLIKVTVKDTKAPEIIFKEDTVSLEYGAEFDIRSNIESVKDPIDGDIPFAESAGENNYYMIEGSVDTSTAGDYTVTVKAKDKNGNEAEKAYTVTVAEEYVAPTYDANTGYSTPSYQQPSSGSGSYTPPASSGGSSAPANTCTFQYYTNLGNSGMTFSSSAEANAWAKAQRMDDNSPWSYNNGFHGNTGWTVRDNCGNEHNDVWTVNFY